MKFVFAGGGTGGHLFPALALAAELKARDENASITFIGALGGIEERAVPAAGYPLVLLDVEGVKGRGLLDKAGALVKAAGAVFKVMGIFKRSRPDGVIGSGSYSSAPVIFAARILGIRTAILEQNALPGLTNRQLGRIVDRVYVAFPEARRHFPALKTVEAGNPVRGEIAALASARREPAAHDPARKGVDAGRRFTLLVFGGSQGAAAVNTAFLDAAEHLGAMAAEIRVIHQTGRDGFEAVKAAYARKKLEVEVHPFIDDMASAYLSADLAVCRAGATSIAELTAAGVPSILIPYPHAADNHQEVNARSLADRGAAVMIRQGALTGAALAEEIKRLWRDRNALAAMAAKARALGRPGAGAEIADDFLKVIKGGHKPGFGPARARAAY